MTRPVGVWFFFCSEALNFLHAFLNEYDLLCNAQPRVRRSQPGKLIAKREDKRF